MKPPEDGRRTLLQIRIWVTLFIVGLVLSGITAFPLQWELDLLARWIDADLSAPEGSLRWWIARVHDGLNTTYRSYSFLGYGTDWLAFGHIVIAMFFIGPWRDPVKNAWVLRVGIAACVGVIPLALICGSVRGIPFYWRLIDCSFGILGTVPLWWCLRLIRRLER